MASCLTCGYEARDIDQSITSQKKIDQWFRGQDQA